MKVEHITAPGAPTPGGSYSHGVVANGFLYTCGKVTAHLQDVNRDFAAYDAVYREFFSAPFPVRTTVGSDLINILVEIDFVVAL